MAKYLMLWMILALFIRMPLAAAEALRDPTMPASQSGLVPVSQLPEVAPAPMLQSIALGTTAKYAMINGKTVMLGQAYEQWVLIKLTANEATLRAKDGSTKVLVMSYSAIKQRLGEPNKAAKLPRLPSKSNTPAMTTLGATNMTNNRSTESLDAQPRVQAETLWVKQ